uniref:Uncharacterized protein n=1 Tax=Anguilla anguilla TaxID=7936 RepID=A0A0E9RK42_ANGAN
MHPPPPTVLGHRTYSGGQGTARSKQRSERSPREDVNSFSSKKQKKKLVKCPANL